MDKSGFIALINPAIALAIAAALFLLWNFRRNRGYVIILAAGFVTLAMAFAVQYAIIGHTQLRLLKLFSNSLIPVGGYLIIHGTLRRYRVAAPLMPIAALCAASMAAFVWYLYREPNLTARIYIMNFLAGGLILMLAVKLAQTNGKRSIDRVLTVFVFVWALQFFVRTFAVLAQSDHYVDGPQFYASLYWITLTLSVASFLLLFAVLLIAAIALDIAEELTAESYVDPLSGLLNRRGLEKRVGDSIGHARASSLPLSLVLCDLDSFKRINDNFGHLAGDRAIVAFCACLKAHLADSHFCARIGGEEFAVILPATPAGAARLFAESVRSAYPNVRVEGIDTGQRLSASFGVAELKASEDFEALMRRADNALYRAKQEGRDRVKVALAELAVYRVGPADQDLPEMSPLAAEAGSVRSR